MRRPEQRLREQVARRAGKRRAGYPAVVTVPETDGDETWSARQCRVKGLERPDLDAGRRDPDNSISVTRIVEPSTIIRSFSEQYFIANKDLRR